MIDRIICEFLAADPRCRGNLGHLFFWARITQARIVSQAADLRFRKAGMADGKAVNTDEATQADVRERPVAADIAYKDLSRPRNSPNFHNSKKPMCLLCFAK